MLALLGIAAGLLGLIWTAVTALFLVGYTLTKPG